MRPPVKWAYGVTTCAERVPTHLEPTLDSLAAAGFATPRLFVDGCNGRSDIPHWGYYPRRLELTFRSPRLGVYGNWLLSLWELYIREPAADRYAVFQDDLLCAANLKAYLDRCPFPKEGYWNLYTFGSNQSICPIEETTGRDRRGWFPSNQLGRGALGLVFDRPGVQTLLSCRSIITKPAAAVKHDRCVDGAVVEALRNCGYTEWVHNPSLLQHTGELSTLERDGAPWHWPKSTLAPSWPEGGWDALTMPTEKPDGSGG